MPPAAFSEHPKYMPAYGATYISHVLDTLTADPAVWSRTVLLVMYDENDGYFDHVVPPQPPTPALPGASTVSTAGEIHDVVNPAHRPVYTVDNLPYGLGPRVPMFVVSPWSKGGYVNSQVFDHTSVIRFIEARFGVREPNISPWRRAVCGDLTSCFDFSRPSAAAPRLASTADYRARAEAEVKHLPVPVPPAEQPDALMAQEPGLRAARPLPYALEVRLAAGPDGKAKLRFENTGAQGANFYAYQKDVDVPLRYTVGAGDVLDAVIPVGPGGFDLGVYGPNGFFRAFSRGPGAGSGLAAVAAARGERLEIMLRNEGAGALEVRVTDNAYGGGARVFTLAAGAALNDAWALAASHHWYDLTVAAAGDEWRFAGHVETGKPSFSDPAATAPVAV
jgi:phospholipase C